MERFRIFQRGKTWYLENAATGKQRSLFTRDKKEALCVLNAHHEAQENPSINVQIGRACVHVAAPAYNMFEEQVANESTNSLGEFTP